MSLIKIKLAILDSSGLNDYLKQILLPLSIGHLFYNYITLSDNLIHHGMKKYGLYLSPPPLPLFKTLVIARALDNMTLRSDHMILRLVLEWTTVGFALFLFPLFQTTELSVLTLVPV